MAANIYFPAIDSLKRDLNASQQVINLSVSLFILLQGIIPMLWSGISEIWGRKIVYMVSFAMFAATQIVCALANSPGLFLAMRALSAAGGSAVLTIGGGTLVSLAQLFANRLCIYTKRQLSRPTSTIHTNEVQWSASITFSQC